AARGSPYEVSEPASPWTRRTAWPSATSTAGSRTRRSVMRQDSSREVWRGGRSVSQRPHPVLEQGGAGVAGLLGVELRRGQRAVLDGRDEPGGLPGRTVGGPRDARRDVARVGGVVVPLGERLGRVGVHEVEPLLLDPGEQGGSRRRL